MEVESRGNDHNSTGGHRSGWFLVARDALPEEWQERAIPVFLVPLDDNEVERLSPNDGWPSDLDEDDRAVAALVGEGVSPHDIATRLHLSRRSVFRRLARLRQLTQSTTNVQLATKLAKHDIARAVADAVRVTESPPHAYHRAQPSDAEGTATDEHETGGAL